MPYNLIPKLILPEYLIHEDLHVVAHVPIQMHVDGRSVTHHGLYGHEVLVHPVQVALLVPHVAVHLLLEAAQRLALERRLRLREGLRHPRVTADVDLLGVVRPAGKGGIDVDEIHLHPLLREVGAGGEALPAEHQVAIGIPAHHFPALRLVERHAALNALEHFAVIPIAQEALRPREVIQDRLPLKDAGIVRDIFYCHDWVCYLKNWLMAVRVFRSRSAGAMVPSTYRKPKRS